MKQEQYESFIGRLEQQARLKPKKYSLRLAAMAALGYAYIGAVLALFIAILGLLGWMIVHHIAVAGAAKLAIVDLFLLWIVVRMMFITMEAPTGRTVGQDEAPALFDLVERLRAEVMAPKIYKVLIVDDFNAAVSQYARFGVFGGVRNYLLLGLPLMQALSPDEFRAVLAHEFGHLSGAHGKFGAWIYRLRSGWARLTWAMEQSGHWSRFLFVPFFKWYSPTFAAYSFVQARRQEYEADRMAVLAAGPSVAGQALVRVALMGHFLENDYWRSIFKTAEVKASPDMRPFAQMRFAFTEHRISRQATATLEEALRQRTNFDDTHPCLKDRLDAMGSVATVPGPITNNAADCFLGALAAELVSEFDDRWRKNTAEWWQSHYRESTESRKKLSELDVASASGALSIEDAYSRAELTEQFVDARLAIEQLEALVIRAPDQFRAHFDIGRLKLAHDDATGIARLEKAMQLEPYYSSVACSLIVNYLRKHGRNEEAHEYLDRLAEATEIDEKSRHERNTVHKKDKLASHDVDANRVAALAEKICSEKDVMRAYLVRKITKIYPNRPMYVLGVQRRSRWWKLETSNNGAALVGRLINLLNFPGDALIVSCDGENRWLRKRLKKIAGSCIFER